MSNAVVAEVEHAEQPHSAETGGCRSPLLADVEAWLGTVEQRGNDDGQDEADIVECAQRPQLPVLHAQEQLVELARDIMADVRALRQEVEQVRETASTVDGLRRDVDEIKDVFARLRELAAARRKRLTHGEPGSDLVSLVS